MFDPVEMIRLQEKASDAIVDVLRKENLCPAQAFPIIMSAACTLICRLATLQDMDPKVALGMTLLAVKKKGIDPNCIAEGYEELLQELMSKQTTNDH